MMTTAAAWPDRHLHVIDLPYCFSSWALDDPENTALWFSEGGDLLAWAVMQLPFWTVDIVCDPAYMQKLYPEILEWVDRCAVRMLDTPGGHPTWFVNIFADQKDRIFDLDAAGYVSQGDAPDHWSKVWMQYQPAHQNQGGTLPEGFIIRPLQGLDEVEAYVDLHCSVFESKNMTTAWRRRTLQQDGYLPDLDLVVTSPDGSLVAFCICWLGEVSGVLCGQIEPMGVSQTFRGQGLGKAILSEGLRRLCEKAAKKIFVETDYFRNAALSLYESSGFQVRRDVLVYRKDFD